MPIGDNKPHVPIFVGSTFTDLKPYRRAATDALTQLETIVHGMEYFGSKPHSPVDECLRTVQSCMVYIGIFGMRYGTIPDGYDKSMTHLEYDEAQKASLPSLIYLIDEDNQPVLPKHFDTGVNATKLRELKALLAKRHTFSTFTTPESLSGRILHDVPELLRQRGTEVHDEAGPAEPNNQSIISEFDELPKLHAGREVSLQFVTHSRFKEAEAETCEALGLEIGATVMTWTKLINNIYMDVFAERHLALKVRRYPEGTTLNATAVTKFGTREKIDHGSSDSIISTHAVKGLLLTKVTPTEPVTSDDNGD